MAYGSQSRTVQEAVAPYWRVVAAAVFDDSTAETIANTTYSPSRAFVNETGNTIIGATLTLAGGGTITMNVLAGVVYPMACTRTSSSSISFLY